MCQSAPNNESRGGQEFESLRARFEACDGAITAKAPQWRRRQRARIPIEPKLFPARRQWHSVGRRSPLVSAVKNRALSRGLTGRLAADGRTRVYPPAARHNLIRTKLAAI
jgi:hypothetical protein